MSEDLRTIILLAGREFRDQLRDWRIVLPLAILTGAFPLLMKEVASQAVSFFARFGTTLIAYRLIPFSILIIGFFPITISLVVALESFVGEKERGTIEPLLNAPLKNSQLYFGKLLAGVITPLTASYLSIGLYLAMVSREALEMPRFDTLILLFMLTTVHAILMVSAALVISVQSTSIRAANLLASFIIIPVAIMMQGESVLLFWGTDGVLWLAVVAVMIVSGMLVRLGLAHFQREYLIGRELDQLNTGWIWNTFWTRFRGAPGSGVYSWYRTQVVPALRKLTVPLLIILGIAVIGFWGSFRWTTDNLPRLLSAARQSDLAAIVKDARDSAGLVQAGQTLSAAHILANNVRATTLVFLGGLVTFSVLGIAAYVINVGLVGGVLGVFDLMGYAPGVLFAAGLLPHGIFEIPALMLASASVLKLGAVLVTPQMGRSMGSILLELLADSAKVLLGVVFPLLIIASLVEAHITPAILQRVFP
ncbi:MAG TPA: stage II sporulation protein M [Anaerolineales bacterium]